MTKPVLDGISQNSLPSRVMPSQNPARRPRRSDALLVAVLVFLAVESTAVASLGTPLLPTVEDAYHVSLSASQWTLTITLLIGAIATPVMGRLGDGRLRRQTAIGAIATMLAGCVLSAVPAGFLMFMTGRAMQGVAFGLVPLATAVARDDLTAERSGSTIALIGITTAAGSGLGYPLVGLLAQYMGLHAPFWLVAALSALALIAAVAVLPESPAPLALMVRARFYLASGSRGSSSCSPRARAGAGSRRRRLSVSSSRSCCSGHGQAGSCAAAIP